MWESWGRGQNSGIVHMVFLSFFILLLSTCFCLYLKCTSRRQHTTGACFYIQSDNLWFLVEVFTPFIVHGITDMVVFKSIILLFVFYLSFVFSAFFELIYYLVLCFISLMDFLALSFVFFPPRANTVLSFM